MVAFLSLSLRGRSPPSVSETCDSFGEAGILVVLIWRGRLLCEKEELVLPEKCFTERIGEKTECSLETR
jgi:hypothetical protein